ncbi:hypothetical protein P3T36_007924, partial [Kitasatospora sp. MAP12-15]
DARPSRVPPAPPPHPPPVITTQRYHRLRDRAVGWTDPPHSDDESSPTTAGDRTRSAARGPVRVRCAVIAHVRPPPDLVPAVRQPRREPVAAPARTRRRRPRHRLHSSTPQCPVDFGSSGPSSPQAVEPPLNEQEIAYLRKFAGTRRMDRHRPAGAGGRGHWCATLSTASTRSDSPAWTLDGREAVPACSVPTTRTSSSRPSPRSGRSGCPPGRRPGLRDPGQPPSGAGTCSKPDPQASRTGQFGTV